MGFCWFGFFLPTIWAVTEGLWRPFAFSLLGYLVTRLANDASSYYGSKPFGLFGLFGYPLVMVVFGTWGKKWLIADMLKHGYATCTH